MEYRTGDRCRLRWDVPAPGGLAFRAGEEVFIMKVDPYPSNPEYRYVVRSPGLQEFFMLRAADLEPIAAAAGRDLPVPVQRRRGSPADNVPGAVLLLTGIGMIACGPLPWYRVFGVNHSGTMPALLSMCIGVFVSFRAVEVLYVLPGKPERGFSRPVALVLSVIAMGIAVYLLTLGKPDGHTLGVSPYLFLAFSILALGASAFLMISGVRK